MSLEPSLDLTLSKSKLDIAHAYSYAQSSVSRKIVSCITKNSIAIVVINQSTIRGLKRSLLAGLDGRVACKCLDASDGRKIYNQPGSYIDWHCCQIDCNQLGLCINGCILSS